MSPREQHLATRRAAGLFDFSFMGLYEFHDTAELELQQSRRLAGIEAGRVAYTLLLNEDGSVFNDATVWNMGDDGWWLFSGRPSDIDWLRGAPRDRSGEHAILALQGPESGRILAGPNFINRGLFAEDGEFEGLMDEARNRVLRALGRMAGQPEHSVIVAKIREVLEGYLYYHTHRRPMIIPIITEV